MTSNAKNARDIFLAALEREGIDREVYLEQTCGDDVVLRERVQAFLRAHDDPAAFLSEARHTPQATVNRHPASHCRQEPDTLNITVSGGRDAVRRFFREPLRSLRRLSETERRPVVVVNGTRAPAMMTLRSSFISERRATGSLAYQWANTPALRLRL
jgi:hypothetical protein